MWTNLKDVIHRASERRRHRRDYRYLLMQENDDMLRDIGVDRIDVKRLYLQTGLL